MIKAIIFDFDDTLVNSMYLRIDKIVSAARELFDLQIETSHIVKLWGLPYNEFNKIVFKDITDFEERRTDYEKLLEVEVEAFEGLLDLLVLLRSKYELGILTSGAKHLVYKDMNRLAIDRSMFFSFVTADDNKFHKPDPRAFTRTLEDLQKKGIKPEEAIYIGDSINDYKAAIGAGLNFLGVTTGKHSRKDFAELGANSVSQLSELQGYL